MLTDRIRVNLMASSERLLEAQDKASSGKRIHRPSDDVPGTARSIDLRSVLASVEQFTRNSGIAASHLSVTSSALDQIVSKLQNVRSLALQAASSAGSEEARSAITSQLTRISAELVGISETQHLGGYIFSGSQTKTPPLAAAPGMPPYTYQGDGSQFNIQVSPGTYITTNVTADMVFNLGGAAVADTADVFEMIEILKENVAAGDVQAISDQLAEIDANLNNVIAIRSHVGGRLARLESTDQGLLDCKVRVSELLSKTEDADLAEAVLELKTQENIYQAAVATASRILGISLVDFFK